MSQHGIETIKIENFKCFESLEINGFKRVNLVGGKNNVGKTALLEALELVSNSYNPYILAYLTWTLLRRRQDKGYLENDLFHDNSISFKLNSNLNQVEINRDISDLTNHLFKQQFDSPPFDNLSDMALRFVVGVANTTIPIGRLSDADLNAFFSMRAKKEEIKGIFVKSSRLSDDELAILYGVIINKDKEHFLEDSIRVFSDYLRSIKVVPMSQGVKLKAKLANKNELVLLSSLGEGVNRYIAILCAIWASQDGYLFIDEIENGIHYTNYPKLWELIFLASAQANCQVFVTSHSKECITAFNNTQLLENTKDSGAYFELFYSQKKQRISAAYRDAEQLKYALDHNEDIRGE
ncbi:MAG: AAA family ATPase [Thiofilum sp.]|uniref:AAA family ATPase n=1 Tax=Thiofilum sp. TaxID=2212733 RepID=UPI0025E0CA10|nr:AAA family ATPase [Thiofilum sp.]MBK8454367.1 AAA family ATPase [Thiofilum sp.]